MYTLLSEAILLKLNKSGGTLTGLLSAMVNPAQDAQVRNITVSTVPLTPGSSALPSGEVYVCYE
jgi:hypothetical protein